MAETNLTADYETFTAAADLSAYQYLAVGYTTNGQVTVNSGATYNYVGILANKPEAQGRAASVVVQGRFKAVAGAAIASYNIPLKVGAGGYLTIATSGTPIVGRNVELASSSGNIITVDLQKATPIGFGGAY